MTHTVREMPSTSGRHRSVTLDKIVDEAFPRPKPTETDPVRDKVAKLKGMCIPICCHRNKRGAHNDEVYATGIETLPEILAQDFADAARLVQEIVNDIQRQSVKEPTDFDDNAHRIKTGGNLLLQKLVWARRWEQLEDVKYTGSRLSVSDDEIENTDWTADPPIRNSLPTSSS